jgi:hypothetical protein
MPEKKLPSNRHLTHARAHAHALAPALVLIKIVQKQG